MSRWTPEDEINLQKWVEEKGFFIVYMPQVNQWGYYHRSNNEEIFAGFNHLSELKQHFVNMKGGNKIISIVSEGDFMGAVESLERRKRLH